LKAVFDLLVAMPNPPSTSGRDSVEALDRLPPGTTINSFTGDVESGPKSKENGEDEPEMRYNFATRRFEPVETLGDDQS
jgi:hypothetical protein